MHGKSLRSSNVFLECMDKGSNDPYINNYLNTDITLATHTSLTYTHLRSLYIYIVISFSFPSIFPVDKQTS